MKPNSNMNHFQQLLLHTITPPLYQYNLFVLQKTGAKTAPLAPKLGYFDGWAPQLSVRVNPEMPAAGLIGHMFPGPLKVQKIWGIKLGKPQKSSSLNGRVV